MISARDQILGKKHILNHVFESLELLRNTCRRRRRKEVDVKLLLQQTTWKVAVSHVRVPMLIPGFCAVARDVVAKVVNLNQPQGTTIGYSSVRIWHSGGMP